MTAAPFSTLQADFSLAAAAAASRSKTLASLPTGGGAQGLVSQPQPLDTSHRTAACSSGASSLHRTRRRLQLVDSDSAGGRGPLVVQETDEAAATAKLGHSSRGFSLPTHPAVRISNHIHKAILYALEEAVRQPNRFTPDLGEESAAMADLAAESLASSRRPATGVAPTGSPSGIRGPRVIMQERAAREARQRELALERVRAETEARLAEESAGKKAAPAEPRQQPQHQHQQPQHQQHQHQHQHHHVRHHSQPSALPHLAKTTLPSEEPPAGFAETSRADASKPRNAFPHAFERWETLSAHWEGLTSYWIRKIEQNQDELSHDAMGQQLARQVTDLSAAGANLFHAVVELQRLRASSERKFQRWFFETRAELERAQEINAMMDMALQKERGERAEAIREALDQERSTSKMHKQLAEMRKELSISKEEARRAWEELGRREQEERDRTFSLQHGQATIVGGVQVVPMVQGSRPTGAGEARSWHDDYQYAYPQAGQPQQAARSGGSPEGDYSQGEFAGDAPGSNMHGLGAPASASSLSDGQTEEYETSGASTQPPSAGYETGPTSPGGAPSRWSGTYSDPQDYSGQGYGTPGWDTVPRHHHPTRLSDVIEEEDERSRTSASQRSRG
ncbi:hypothetical protein CDD81_5116 [Ophiocordyceps australis]|uniref:Uncharacterized protein n=1 Tax=Ophiocordyceps australis TaxID=1399860 RepID=A0A2C5YAV2_9HYPO|nr:hypothetical protein CDD81_5116 [Ophiocordyceps australis]